MFAGSKHGMLFMINFSTRQLQGVFQLHDQSNVLKYCVRDLMENIMLENIWKIKNMDTELFVEMMGEDMMDFG